jgi:hypothetical protein
MARQTRTTRNLAERIDRNYFRKPFRLSQWESILSIEGTAAALHYFWKSFLLPQRKIPQWKGILYLGGTAMALLWIGTQGISSNRIYSAGPLSHSHRIVADKCVACHAQSSSWGTRISDKACRSCHDAPVHQAKQTFTPACSDCHIEHRNTFSLSAIPDPPCTRCHSDLKANVRQGQTRFASDIRSFLDGHPEFAAVRPGHPPDPGQIKLNHKVHLMKDLAGPNGPVQMVCSDCHQPEAPVPSNQVSAASADEATMNQPAMDQYRRRLSPNMVPVTFEKHCMSCHTLLFDKRFRDPAPHKDTKTVDAYVTAKYADYIAKHPAEVHDPLQLIPGLPSRPLPQLPRNAAEWVAQRVQEAERLLWQKSCKECHLITYPAPSARPEVLSANETVHWMKNAWFDHRPHQVVACVECHTNAPRSQRSADVLLPGIDTCRRCHNQNPNAAETRCSECHTYHNWSKARPVLNAGTISQLAR